MPRSHSVSTTSLAAYEPLPEQEPSSTGSYRWFAILWIVALLTASLHENMHVHTPKNEPHFNFLLFSQETSSGYCAGQRHCAPQHMRAFWTIHGLWPSNDTTWPQFCDKSMKFNVTLLEPIRDDLEKFWPSAISENNGHFWSHEWDKHGTCASILPELSGILNYFNATLNLLRTYNVSNFLLNDNIVPSKTRLYDVNEILRALQDDLSTKANIACQKVTGYAYPILTEVRFCLSKSSLTPIDCKIKHENCGPGKIFYLPMDVHVRPSMNIITQTIFDIFKWYVHYMSPV